MDQAAEESGSNRQTVERAPGPSNNTTDTGAELKGWPGGLFTYMPELEYGEDNRQALVALEQTFSDETSVFAIEAQLNGSGISTFKLPKKINRHIPFRDPSITIASPRRPANLNFDCEPQNNPLQFLSISRFLVKKNGLEMPQDANKLRISKSSFRYLMTHFELPPAFITALSRYNQPSGKGYRQFRLQKSHQMYDFWYILPVRVQVPCTDGKKAHASSSAGRNQMNPFNYLHLQDREVDIRGSQIAIFSQFDKHTGKTSILCVNLLDGRWHKIVEEPQRRVIEALKICRQRGLQEDPFFIHLIYLTSVIRWWTNVLSTFNDQLIAQEKRLQDEMETAETNVNNFNNDMNKSLHTMAAHLYRYGSELGRLEDAVYVIAEHHDTVCPDIVACSSELRDGFNINIKQVMSQLQSIMKFREELEKKTQNILALLFNNVQVTNDMMMYANGKAMQNILEAMQLEAKMSRRMADQSQQIALEMKKDSISMKTIAILTMFFLPGTSFAAVLAMPFFTNNAWLGEASKIWIWILLTFPSTGLAFAFYWMWKKREMNRKSPLSDDENDIEMNPTVQP